MISTLMCNNLIWLPSMNVGYYDVDPDTSKPDYFSIYVEYAKTPMGIGINNFRTKLVNKYIGNDPILDFGCSCGSFIQTRNKIHDHSSFGYDVQSTAVKYLQNEGLYLDPFSEDYIENISFWDSLEHLKHFDVVIKKVHKFVFLTIPIVKDMQHALISKHLKVKEHYWHFTEQGLIYVMNLLGFKFVAKDDTECTLGREDVLTFVFRKKS